MQAPKAPWHAFMAIGSLALLSAACAPQEAPPATPTGTTSRPSFEVVNVDGPAVSVVPWIGGPSTTITCGRGLFIDTSSAPKQPWLVTVVSSTTNRVLLHQRGSGDLELIVRASAVVLGAPAPSVGPAGQCSAGT